MDVSLSGHRFQSAATYSSVTSFAPTSRFSQDTIFVYRLERAEESLVRRCESAIVSGYLAAAVGELISIGARILLGELAGNQSLCLEAPATVRDAVMRSTLVKLITTPGSPSCFFAEAQNIRQDHSLRGRQAEILKRKREMLLPQLRHPPQEKAGDRSLRPEF